MLLSKIETAVEDLTTKILSESPEFEFIDAEYVKEGGSFILRLLVDKEGGMGLDDCQKLSERIGGALDRDPTLNSMLSENYLLEVSSPGIDRILKKDRDFIRERGKMIDVKLFAPLDGEKFFVGKLVEMVDRILTIDLDGSQKKIPMKDVAQVRLHIDF